MKNCELLSRFAFVCLLLIATSCARADFKEDFNGDSIKLDPKARLGWGIDTGDGEATISLSQANGIGRVSVDCRNDRRNIWWAYIRRSLLDHIDPKELQRPDRELRVKVKVRVSHAPRRINLHFNHSSTTDFHSHLMEYEIPDTENWHEVSFTTNGFDANLDDEVFVQLAMMDWGQSEYFTELDYLTVELVDPSAADPDKGVALPYRPELPPVSSFEHSLPPAQAAVVDSTYPWVNFKNWKALSGDKNPSLLTTSGTQTILLRWDFESFKPRSPSGWGRLALTTHSVQWADTGLEEFGELRVVEILAGDPHWNRESVTFENFLAKQEIDHVLNEQMIVDAVPAFKRGDRTLISISPPVMERLISGKSRGIAIYTQGAVIASFYADASDADTAPLLYFNLDDD